ncbi:MAG: chromate efflux transporter [Pseudomonadota bacterium]
MSLIDLTRIFARIGVVSFGGPAAQIALMQRELVDERTWLTEDQFLRALSFCMLLPGPEAMQLATYAGWRLRGVQGGLIAGALFVLPGAIVIAILAAAYVTYGALDWVEAAFLGIKAAVLVIVIQALWRLSRRALRGTGDIAVALLAFVALFLSVLPYPVLIAAAALWGAWRSAPASHDPAPPAPLGTGLWRTGTIWLSLWLGPLAAIHLFAPGFLADIARFFSILAVVTFGGAYALLAYMAQVVVGEFGWVTTPQMLDALGLAETTPGPLILVTQFVAFLAGYAQGGYGLALAAALISLWMTFVPCFLWIFTAAPWIDWVTTRPRLKGALAAVTAAVVGVIAYLAVWLGLHVLFARLSESSAGPFRATWPDLASIDPIVIALAALAAVVLFGLRLGLIPTIAIAATAGLALG